MKLKIGRPSKTEEQKLLVKQIHNSTYYQSKTKNKRLLEKIISDYSEQNKKTNNKEYKGAIVSHFSKYMFTDFFTGTSNANYLQKEQIELYNQKYKEINREYNTEYSLKKHIPVSLNGLKKYTDKYINYLMDLKIVDRAIVFFEQNKSDEWHCHILLNVINSCIVDIDTYLENKWLLGISLNVNIPTKDDAIKLLQYSVKQINILSNRKSDKDKALNWQIAGDYTVLDKNKINMNKTTIEQLEKIKNYKMKYNLTVTPDTQHQKYLNDRYVRFSA